MKKLNVKIRWPESSGTYIIWVFLVATGALGKWYCGKDVPPVTSRSFFTTSRALPVNHQLASDDLQLETCGNKSLPPFPVDTFMGRHLLAHKKEGEEITLAETGLAPYVLPDDDKRILLLPLNANEAILSQQVQPGFRIQICIGDTGIRRCSAPATVAAVHTSTRNAQGNFIWLEIAQEEINSMTQFVTAQSRAVSILTKKND